MESHNLNKLTGLKEKTSKKKGDDFTNYFTLLTNEQSLIDYIQADTSGDSIPS